MQHIWAPWRMEFILAERPKGCIFCDIPRRHDALRENLVLHRGSTCFAVLNRYPYTCGHVLVVPYRHTDDFLSLSEAERAESARLLQVCVRVLQATHHPEGFNLGTNLGRPAGAAIDEHIHHHVVPRWVGDSNFFPVVGDTRSLPEALLDTWDKMRPRFREWAGPESAPPAPGEPSPGERSSTDASPETPGSPPPPPEGSPPEGPAHGASPDPGERPSGGGGGPL